ncbi:hypothetical protein BJV77DRAFT_213741 [Russula vinacea]|nr:hypothetical protein BJV77DRAFT_213741 [Russula vinacea]
MWARRVPVELSEPHCLNEPPLSIKYRPTLHFSPSSLPKMSSAVITPETKDTPSLTVTISKLSSSSPFPSPGSPFFPPPIPSAHEYAPIPLPSSKRRSTESRMMNVGSNKTDHESAASVDPLVDASSVASPTAAGKTSGPETEPQSTLDKREEGTSITGGGITNGLVEAVRRCARAAAWIQTDCERPSDDTDSTQCRSRRYIELRRWHVHLALALNPALELPKPTCSHSHHSASILFPRLADRERQIAIG